MYYFKISHVLRAYMCASVYINDTNICKSQTHNIGIRIYMTFARALSHVDNVRRTENEVLFHNDIDFYWNTQLRGGYELNILSF